MLFSVPAAPPHQVVRESRPRGSAVPPERAPLRPQEASPRSKALGGLIQDAMGEEAVTPDSDGPERVPDLDGRPRGDDQRARGRAPENARHHVSSREWSSGWVDERKSSRVLAAA